MKVRLTNIYAIIVATALFLGLQILGAMEESAQMIEATQ